MKVEFKPWQREDGRFALQVFRNQEPIGFVHWIETTNGKICTVNRGDFVMCPVWSLDEAQANCNWLNNAYERGEIK